MGVRQWFYVKYCRKTGVLVLRKSNEKRFLKQTTVKILRKSQWKNGHFLHLSTTGCKGLIE
jgi:hypothetical protein